MGGFFASLVAVTIATIVALYVVPGVHVRSSGAGVVAGLVYGLMNALLFKLLFLVTLPLQLLTFGLGVFVLNAFLLFLTDKLVDGIEIPGAVRTFGVALVISFVNALIRWIF